MMSSQLSRRSLIRGSISAAGAMAMWSMFEKRALAAGNAPKRVIIWYVPEGAAQQAFWPAHGPGPLQINMNASVGNGLTPESKGESINGYRSEGMGTYCLQPLADHTPDITLLSGFENRGDTSHDDDHMKVVANALTCGGLGGIDQWLGDHLHGDSVFHAIFSSLYGEHIGIGKNPAYASPFRTKNGAAGDPSWNPVTTYNRVFPNGVGELEPGEVSHALLSRLRVMGAVRSRLGGVANVGGAAAKERIENYLGSIERIESETAALIEAEENGPPTDVTVDVPEEWIDIDNDNKYWHDADNFEKMFKIQLDTTIAALALDRTRVSLLQFSATGVHSGLKGDHYQRVGIEGLSGGDTNDHYLGHESDSSRRIDQARIFRWYYEQIAYLIKRLKEIPEADGTTLFDNTLIFCTSEFGMYNHRNNDIPYMLIGNPGGKFGNKGMYLDAHSGGFRNSADLFLAVCRGMGMDIDKFGSSESAYDEILA